MSGVSKVRNKDSGSPPGKMFVYFIYIAVFWIILPSIVIIGSHIFDRSFTLSPLSGYEIAGWIIISLSALLLAFSILQFIRDAGELPVSAYPPDHIVRTGIYAFYRHPIYLFYCTLFLGIGLVVGSMAMVFIVIPIFVCGVFIYALLEERNCVKRFGTDYQAYQEQAGILIPKFHMVLSIPFAVLSWLFFPIRIRNAEYRPEKAPFFLVANHRNYLDPFMVAYTLPFKVHYVTTYQMFRKKITALFFTLLGCIPKRRYVNDSTAVKQIMKVLKKGGVIGIFPEGERSYTGELLSLKTGPMKLFMKFAEVPIVPVSLSGNYIMWPRWGRGWRRCGVTVTYHRPVVVEPNETVKTLQRRIGACIQPEDIDASTTYRKRAHSLECFLYRCPVCRTFDSLYSREDTLCCRECGHQWLMTVTYTLCDKTEKRVSTIREFYNTLRITGADIKNQEDICSNACECSIEHGMVLKRLFTGHIRLLRDRLIAHPDVGSTAPVVIMIQDLLSATLEGTMKLQVYDNKDKQLYQFVFKNESARKWQDYIAEYRYALVSEYPLVR